MYFFHQVLQNHPELLNLPDPEDKSTPDITDDAIAQVRDCLMSHKLDFCKQGRHWADVALGPVVQN